MEESKRWNDQMHPDAFLFFWDNCRSTSLGVVLKNCLSAILQGTRMLDAGAGTGLLSHCLKETLRPHGKRCKKYLRCWLVPLFQLKLQSEITPDFHKVRVWRYSNDKTWHDRVACGPGGCRCQGGYCHRHQPRDAFQSNAIWLLLLLQGRW